MKKIFTLTLASLFTVALFAARNPSVTLSTSSNYEVSIDGKNYFSHNSGNMVNIPNMQPGSHSIEVYQVKKKLFGKDRTLISSSSFTVRDRDIAIYVDDAGRLDIRETGSSVNPEDRNSRNADGNNSDRRSRGRGHKYGHNKDWKENKVKNKELKNKEWKNKDKDDDDLDDDGNGYGKTKEKQNNGKNKGKGKS